MTAGRPGERFLLRPISQSEAHQGSEVSQCCTKLTGTTGKPRSTAVGWPIVAQASRIERCTVLERQTRAKQQLFANTNHSPRAGVRACQGCLRRQSGTKAHGSDPHPGNEGQQVGRRATPTAYFHSEKKCNHRRDDEGHRGVTTNRIPLPQPIGGSRSQHRA